jgi:putative redox protein
MSITIALYARQKKWPLENVEIRLRHSRNHLKDCERCMTKDTMLDQIDAEVRVGGPLSGEQRARLLEIGEKCPVHRTLNAHIHATVIDVE